MSSVEAYKQSPLFLTSNPSKPSAARRSLGSLVSRDIGSHPIEFTDVNNKFRFYPFSDRNELLDKSREQSQHWPIVICTDGRLPERSLTPLFDLNQYYQTLSEARKQAESPADTESWGIGDVVLYGETVTSTQALLEKNPRLLSELCPPIVYLASRQLAGRGRGSNVWYSPLGCLQFSLFLRISLSELPASKLVFVQYLFALAVVEACREGDVLGVHAEHVKLKWPNDLYAVTGEVKKKIGGILVNTSFSDGKVDIIIGCGLNVLNSIPLSSLSQVVPDPGILTLERIAALVMARFAPMWLVFIRDRGSFEPFFKRYLDCWMHSNQIITLTTNGPLRSVRIVGITLDHGLLRTVPIEKEAGGEFIDLQPDLNSFDVMAGLIKEKYYNGGGVS
ncbi:hypothetical protein AX15_004719 [Amanita polypyramis BW_CC]|nr:hypothetical protein AX15_004719 [Amanita polypyramis BW_CC]